MAIFSNISENNIDWDLTGNLSITEPYITSVTITASTFTSRKLILPRVTSSVATDNFTHGHTIVVRDPNGLLSTNSRIDIEPNSADTTVTVKWKLSYFNRNSIRYIKYSI